MTPAAELPPRISPNALAWLVGSLTALLASSLYLTGGSSRTDILLLVPLRLVAIAALAALAWFVPGAFWRRQRGALAMMAAAAALIAVQLIPLPPSVWASLPGREFYADLLRAAGLGDIWRPISLAPDLTISSLLALLPPAAAYFCCAFAPPETRLRLLQGLLIVTLLTVVLGFLQRIGGGQTLHLVGQGDLNDAVGPFANRNHNAVFLAMAIPVATWWARRPSQILSPAVRHAAGILLIALIIVGILSTGSRAGLAVAGVALVLSVPLALVGGTVKLGMRGWWIVAAAVVLVLGGIAGFAFLIADSGRFTLETVSQDLRLRVFHAVWEGTLTFMPVGSGFGTFDPVYRRFELTETLAPQYLNQAHNDLVQIMFEGGIASLILLGLFLGWLGKTTMVMWSRAARLQRGLDLARAMTVAIPLPLLASLTDYPLRTPLLASLMAVFLAMLALGDKALAGIANKRARDTSTRSPHGARRARGT